MKNNFIRTTDEDTAMQLSKLGFQKINDSSCEYVFVNCNKLQFSNEIDTSKIAYTDILCI